MLQLCTRDLALHWKSLVSSQSEVRDVFMYITTERIGQHKFLLSIIHDHCNFRKKKHIMKFIWEKIYDGGIVWLQLYRIFNKNKQLMRESRLRKL